MAALSLTLESCVRTARFATVDDLLDEFNKAAAVASLKRYFGCFASKTSRFLGTDKHENWTLEEFWDYTTTRFLRGDGWTYVPKGLRKIDIYPTFAVFDETVASNSFKATGRGTGCCEYDSQFNCWFLVTYHLSFPIPNPLANTICSIIADFETRENDADILLLKEK